MILMTKWVVKHAKGRREIHVVTGSCIMACTRIIGLIVQSANFKSITKNIIGNKIASKVVK